MCFHTQIPLAHKRVSPEGKEPELSSGCEDEELTLAAETNRSDDKHNPHSVASSMDTDQSDSMTSSNHDNTNDPATASNSVHLDPSLV